MGMEVGSTRRQWIEVGLEEVGMGLKTGVSVALFVNNYPCMG